MADPTANKTLIAMNQRGLYDAYRKRLENSGRWAVLFSDSAEFIFGDGFLHNFPASSDGFNASRKCVLPLTPTITVVFMLPMSHPTEPRLVTLRLSAREVGHFNEMVQIYAKDFLFFRSQQPDILPVFAKGDHRQFKYHNEPWLDALLDDLAQYNLWGPGGTPSRSGPRPSSGMDAATAARLNVQSE